jgi:hypothetical protein
MDSLGLSEKQARGLVGLAGFSSQKAVQTLMVESSSFKIGFDIFNVEIFESKGCCDDAFCSKGHALKAKYWIRLGVDTDTPRDVGVGITCLSHMEGLTEAEKRAVATIGTWTISLAVNEITRQFGTAKAKADATPGASALSGQDVYAAWISRKEYRELIDALPFVGSNVAAGATKRKYGRASLTASVAIAQQCDEHELPCPTVHRRRIMAAYRRLVHKGLCPSPPASVMAAASASTGAVDGVASVPPSPIPALDPISTQVYPVAAAWPATGSNEEVIFV